MSVTERLKIIERQAKQNAENWQETTAVSTKAILAVVEAFRALEQHVEAAEANNLLLKHRINEEQARSDAAESKLAELEKQEPAGTVWVDCTTRGTEYEFRPLREIINGQELFTRPAPAVSLEELVPDDKSVGIIGKNDNVTRAFIDEDAKDRVSDGDLLYTRPQITNLLKLVPEELPYPFGNFSLAEVSQWNACRAAMINNLEKYK